VRALVTHFAVRGKIGEALSFCLLHTLLLAILYVIVAAAALPPI
jgi:hypothetical protein